MLINKLKTTVFLLLTLSFSAYAQSTSSALVIVDMQKNKLNTPLGDKYNDDLNKLFASQVQIIDKAIKKNIPILLIETKGAGPTISSLKEKLNGYEKLEKFQKSTLDLFQLDRSYSQSIFANSLELQLKNWKVKSLIFIGPSESVGKGIEGALFREYKAVSYSPGVIDIKPSGITYPYNFQPRSKGIIQRYYDNIFNRVHGLDEVYKPQDLIPYLSPCVKNLMPQ